MWLRLLDCSKKRAPLVWRARFRFLEIPLLASFPSDDYVVIETELTERSLHTADKNVRPFFLYAVTFVV